MTTPTALDLVTKTIASQERATGACVKACDALYTEGFRVATMQDKEHEHRKLVTIAIIAGLPADMRKLLETDKAAMKGMSDEKKKRRREAQQRIGRYIALFAGHLATMQENDLNAQRTDLDNDPIAKVDRKTGEVEMVEPANGETETVNKYDAAKSHIEKAIAALQESVELPDGKDATKMIKALQDLIK